MLDRSPLGNVSRHAWKVWRRDLDTYLITWKTNFLPPLLEPVLYILAFGVGLGQLIGTVSYQGRTVPYLTFMVPGILSVAVMFWAYFECTYSSFVRMYYQRTFDAIVATPLLVEDVIAGEWLWGATKSVIAVTIMLAMCGAFGLVTWPWALLAVPVAAVGGLLFAALGLVTTSLSPTIDSFNLPIFVLVMPMFLFSGTFFPIDILPPWATAVALALPLTHVSFLVRGACFAQPPPHLALSVAYLGLGAALATWLGVTLMRRRLVK
jgi:lipooligosaccharide transport system permease protein